MHLSIVYVALVSWFVQSTSAFESQTVAGHPCIRRNKQIFCPFPGSKLSQIFKASNSSIKLGPVMYYKRFTTERPNAAGPITTTTTTSTTTALPTVVRSTTHVIYYTKQYDERNGQNAFDLNDDDEHRFMHEPNVEENVIDDGRTIRNVKRRRIDMFIEENKALIRRMFGTHQNSEDDWMFADNFHDHFSSFHEESKGKRRRPKRSIKPTHLSGNKIDSCESSVEIVTPYWASNSAGKIRAIVNTQHLQQAIQQEVCQAVQTKRCHKDCTCEQKYKWHRLLSYDPDDDCKGIFMDWFLFPSCCVCRCTKL